MLGTDTFEQGGVTSVTSSSDFFTWNVRHLFLLLSVTWTPLKLEEFLLRWHIVILSLEAGNTLITNLGQVYLILNRLLHLFNVAVSFRLLLWEQFFLNLFQGHNLLVNDQNFKIGGNIKKREDQVSRKSIFFLRQFFFLLFLFLQILQLITTLLF